MSVKQIGAKAACIDDDAKELEAAILALLPRIRSGHIRAVIGVLVTDDPADDLADEGFEIIDAGLATDDAMVHLALSGVAEAHKLEWMIEHGFIEVGED